MNEHDSSDAPLNGSRLKLIFIAVAILVATSSLAFGQAPRNNKGRKSEDDARRQVLATDDRRTDALRRNDGAPLHQIYADDYTLVTPSTGTIALRPSRSMTLFPGGSGTKKSRSWRGLSESTATSQ